MRQADVILLQYWTLSGSDFEVIAVAGGLRRQANRGVRRAEATWRALDNLEKEALREGLSS